jgi:hypothetical protein
MERIRLWHIERATHGLEVPMLAYASARNAGNPAALPNLRIRGCSPLQERHDSNGNWEIWAECSRGIGAWDELVYRNAPDLDTVPRVSHLGSWRYYWD